MIKTAEYIRPQEVREMLNVGYTTINRYRDMGQLRYEYDGRRYLYNKDDVLALKAKWDKKAQDDKEENAILVELNKKDWSNAEKAEAYREMMIQKRIDEGWMTSSEAADYVGCSRATLFNYRDKGELKAEYDGKGWRYPVEALDEFKKTYGTAYTTSELVKRRSQERSEELQRKIPEEIARAVVQNALAIALQPPIDTNDATQMWDRAQWYFRYCIDGGIMPTVPGLSAAFGVSRSVFYSWKNGKQKKPIEVRAVIDKCYQILAAINEANMIEGNVDKIVGIFLAKASFGYREDEQQFDSNVAENSADVDKVAQKYNDIED